MKKILFVINTMGRAGAETALIELMRRLQAKGDCELSLYAMLPYGELFSRVPEGVRVLNRRVRPRSVLSFSGRVAIMFRVLRAFFWRLTGFRMLGELRENLRAQKRNGRVQYDKLFWPLLARGTPALAQRYDLAVAFLEGAATYYVADRVSAARKAAFIHIDYRRAGYLPEMDRGCYERIDRVFAVSNEAAARFLEVYPGCREKTRIMRNLLNREEIQRKARQGAGFTDGFAGRRLVTVGRLHYQKGYDIAIEALRMLVDRGYDLRWYICGEGPERAALTRQIEARALKDRFILLGSVENPYQYVGAADVYVHATRFEGKSIAIEEAQILGRAIVASECTGNNEQIENDVDGILLPLDAESLARGIARVLDDDELRARLERGAAGKELEHPEDLVGFAELLEEDRAR